jgi:hypothetical protein
MIAVINVVSELQHQSLNGWKIKLTKEKVVVQIHPRPQEKINIRLGSLVGETFF